MSLYNIIDRSEQALVRTAYRLKHNREKLARYGNHLTFLLRCRRYKVIPNGLRVRLPINSKKGNRIAERTNEAVLRERISEARRKKARIEREINTSESHLKGALSNSQWTDLDDMHREAEKATFQTTKTRQKAKFQQLINNRDSPMPALDRSKVVINLSKRTLTTDEEEALSLGLNFALLPKTMPVTAIISNTESTARQLNPTAAEQLRAGVSEVLASAKPPRSNLPYRLRTALRVLRKDDFIVILPADKGNATVVLNRSVYDQKMKEIINDNSTYRKLSRDPTTRIEKKISGMIRDVHRRGGIPDKLKDQLSPSYSNPPADLRSTQDPQGEHPPQTHRRSNRLPHIPPGQRTGSHPVPACWPL